MLAAVLSGFILAMCMPLIGKYVKRTMLPTLLPLGLFVYFLSFLPDVSSGRMLYFVYEWIPSIGVNLQFHLDGLAMLFALLITGIGTLVFLYSSYYMKGYHYTDRFYGYLSMFMGSMLGLVLSDNIISLFIFWELTSISSFFLIGFNNENAASRKSALTALLVTGSGGLMLLAAFVLLGHVSDSYSIVDMLRSGTVLQDNPLYGAIVILLFLGAFTKSAQFPFTFWLPAAMKAPTPVSTYLHSATMVKAGVYLLARFTPLLGDTALWNNTLMIIGGFTMIYAAFHAIFRKDLKEILAFSTVSALGILVFLIGIGTKAALLAAAVFILVHALYKATLFLIAGVIDHNTATRDISKLGGLRKVMLPVAIAGVLAAISNAGIPPSFGFLGKDLIYEGTLGAPQWALILTILAVLTNIFLLFAGFLAGVKPFFGKLPQRYEKITLPEWRMWIPPLLLATLGIVFGIFPGLIEKILIQPVLHTMMPDAGDIHLKLWHGFNLVLLLSGITVASGLLLYFFSETVQKGSTAIASLSPSSPQNIFEKLADAFVGFSRLWTGILQNGYLKYYMITVLGFLIVLLGYRLFNGVNLYIDPSQFGQLTFYEVGMVFILLGSMIFVIITRSRLVAVISMGGVGYALCLVFVFYSAPDLAMTQFTIDTLTVVLFVLVMSKLPPYLKHSSKGNRLRDGVIAMAFGILITILAIEVLNEPVNREISRYYAEHAYTLARGKNVVNVILVDFRGLDTLIEITVLVIAAIGVFGLLKFPAKSAENE
jgi:multicomponent Na+:H+ antiporter subunit A